MDKRSNFILGFGTALIVVILIGCGSLIPKRVEFMQDKVKEVPVESVEHNEVLRQAAAAAAESADDTFVAAVRTDAPEEVVVPAADAKVLTEAVSTAVGPPLKESVVTPGVLAKKLTSFEAQLDRKLAKFSDKNNENVGKAIEGTGLFSLPYFVWVGAVGVFAFFGLLVVGALWAVVKAAAVGNPPLALGVGAAKVGSSLLRRSLTEIVEGGERFKNEIKAKFSEEEGKKILDMFRVQQERTQSTDVQNVVKNLTL